MNGPGNRFHNRHVKKKDHEIMKRTALLDENELEITEDGLEVYLTSQTMAMLLHSRTGLVVDPRKIRKHYTAKCQQKVSKDSGEIVKMSPAEQVICSLTSKKNVSLVYLVANVKLGRDLATTYTRRKGHPGLKDNLRLHSNLTLLTMAGSQ